MKHEKAYAIPYPDRDDAYIVVKRIHEPYGNVGEEVVSIGCTLKGNVENPTWKVHVPIDLIDDVIMAIKFAMAPEVEEL
jgi:hypothetical protein